MDPDGNQMYRTLVARLGVGWVSGVAVPMSCYRKPKRCPGAPEIACFFFLCHG